MAIAPTATPKVEAFLLFGEMVSTFRLELNAFFCCALFMPDVPTSFQTLSRGIAYATPQLVIAD
jgi:hypothetical protein